jgi:hypothetical protein
VLKRFFGTELPKRNELQSGGKFLCTELADCLPDYIVPKEVKAEDLSIISPYQLYLKLINKKRKRRK